MHDCDCYCSHSAVLHQDFSKAIIGKIIRITTNTVTISSLIFINPSFNDERVSIRRTFSSEEAALVNVMVIAFFS